jgi:protein-tyrosine kinase
MSRFDKALERARSAASGRTAPSGVKVPEGTPTLDVFEAPWHQAKAAPDGVMLPEGTPALEVFEAPWQDDETAAMAVDRDDPREVPAARRAREQTPTLTLRPGYREATTELPAPGRVREQTPQPPRDPDTTSRPPVALRLKVQTTLRSPRDRDIPPPAPAALRAKDDPAALRAKDSSPTPTRQRAATTDVQAAPRVRGDFAEKVISHAAVSAVAIEQYGNLAEHLQRWKVARGGNLVMLASAVSGEGRTLTALNLALALRSSSPRGVLLVDADVWRPGLNQVLLVEARSGLSDAVESGEAPAPIVVSTGLALLPAGRPTTASAAMLASDEMRAVLRELSAEYDWVLIDTPPLGEVPDAAQLGRLVDGILLVVANSRTDIATLRQAVAEVPDDRIIGVVLNDVPR